MPKIQQIARTVKNAALDLVFPPTCPLCGIDSYDAGLETTTGQSPQFCQLCLTSFTFFTDPLCTKCGCQKPTSSQACPFCLDAKLPQEATIALGEYENGLRDAVLKMKHAAGESLALAMGELFWQRCQDRLLKAMADVIVPIPIHWTRRVWRGTNGPEIMAELLGRRLGVPVENGLLRRLRSTLPQSGLRPTQRKRNLRNALAVSRAFEIGGARILLVDDVMTTGATTNAAIRVLRQAGAECTIVAVLARPTNH